MGESLVHTHEQPSLKEQEQARIARFERVRNDVQGLSLEQKKELVKRLEANPKMQDLLQRLAVIAGPLWDGWEKGVNGAVDGTVKTFNTVGTGIGETLAEATNGQEGGLVEKLTQDTQGIRDLLDVTGIVIGETAAKIVSTGEGNEVLDATTTFWKETGDTVANMTPEEQAKLAGEGLAILATAGVTMKGLDKVSKVGVLSENMSVGNYVVAKAVDKGISEAGQIGMELVGGNRTEKPKANLHAKEAKTVIPQEEILANASLKPKERIRKAETILREQGTLGPNEHLSKKQVAEMFGSHNAGKGVNELEKLGDIKEKVVAGKEAGKARAEKLTEKTGNPDFAGEGFNKEQRKVLMDNGVMGELRTSKGPRDIRHEQGVFDNEYRQEIEAKMKAEGDEFKFDTVRSEIRSTLDANREVLDRLAGNDKLKIKMLEEALLKDYREYMALGSLNKVEAKIKQDIYDYFDGRYHVVHGTSGEKGGMHENFTKRLKEMPKDVKEATEALEGFNKSMDHYSVYLEKLAESGEKINVKTFATIRQDLNSIMNTLTHNKEIIKFEAGNNYLSSIVEMQNQIGNLSLKINNPEFSEGLSILQERLSTLRIGLEGSVDARNALTILKK